MLGLPSAWSTNISFYDVYVRGGSGSLPGEAEVKPLSDRQYRSLARFRHRLRVFLRFSELSAREVEVLLAWLAAESKEDAAQALFISSSTVSTHIVRIRAKYASVGRPATSKSALFARAVQDGLTTLDEW